MIFPVKPQPCPHCGGHCDAATDTETPARTEGPRVDEVGLCWHCCHTVTYGAGGVLRKTTVADLERLPFSMLFDLLMSQKTMIRRRQAEKLDRAKARHANN